MEKVRLRFVGDFPFRYNTIALVMRRLTNADRFHGSLGPYVGFFAVNRIPTSGSL